MEKINTRNFLKYVIIYLQYSSSNVETPFVTDLVSNIAFFREILICRVLAKVERIPWISMLLNLHFISLV